jgi:uncharacterized protein YciI
MVHSRGWDPARPIRDQDDWDIHAAFMDALVEDGFVLLGGPIGENEGALLLVEASDEEQVRARLGQDPWVRAGLLRVALVEPWLIWLDGRTGSSSP